MMKNPYEIQRYEWIPFFIVSMIIIIFGIWIPIYMESQSFDGAPSQYPYRSISCGLFTIAIGLLVMLKAIHLKNRDWSSDI